MAKGETNNGSRILRHILTNLTTSAGFAVTAGAASISPTNSSPEGRGSLGDATLVPPTSPPSMLAVAISNSVTIPTNPSMALTSPAVTTTAKPDQHLYNSTGYLVEQDEIEYSILAAFSDMQTVFLACIATLLPLIAALAIAFGLRHAWRKYRNRRNSLSGWYRGFRSREEDIVQLPPRLLPEHTRGSRNHTSTILDVHQLMDSLIEPENRVMESLVMGIPYNDSPTMENHQPCRLTNNVDHASPVNHTSQNANGNIITLTLKNNHLIVETEERAGTLENNSNYQDNECSFVLEAHPANGNSSRVSDQRALVHREENPEDRASDFDKAKLFGSTNTGLSQSDLSISSQGPINHSYRYGNQVEYDAGHFGYPMYGNGVGDYESDSASRKLEGGSKWVEIEYSPDTEKTLLNESKASINSSIEQWVDTDYSSDMYVSNDSKNSSIDSEVNGQVSSVDKRNNIDASQDSGSSLEQQESPDASNSTDTVRSNPNLQVNGTTPNKLESMERKSLINDIIDKSTDSNKPVITGVLFKDETQEDTFQEQQRKLGNGTLTPEHKNNEQSSNKEQKPEGTSTFIPCHKRSGSIPPRLIEDSLEIDRKKPLDIYSQIKTSTKSILPGLSPKFELLQNDVSPIEERES